MSRATTPLVPFTNEEERALSPDILNDLVSLSRVDPNTAGNAATAALRNAITLAHQILSTPTLGPPIPVPTAASSAEIADLKAKITSLKNQIKKLNTDGQLVEKERNEVRTELAREREINDLLRSSSQSRHSAAPKTEPIPDPPLFDGSREALRPFIAGLRMKIIGNSSRFPTDQHSLMYSFGRTTGLAQGILLPYVRNDKIDLNSQEDLYTLLENSFGDPDRVATANREIRKLRQGNRELSVYYSDFCRIVADLDWNESSKISQFREGLSQEVKQALVSCAPSTDFSDLVQLCLRIDNNLRQIGGYTKPNFSRSPAHFAPPQSNTTSPSPSVPTRNLPIVRTDNPAYLGPAPMDLSATRSRHISAEEKQRRLDTNSCNYCGIQGHYARECPNKTVRRYQVPAGSSAQSYPLPSSISENSGKA
jgi:hypothetical protein